MGKSVYLGTIDHDDSSKVYNDQLFPRVQSALVTGEDLNSISLIHIAYSQLDVLISKGPSGV